MRMALFKLASKLFSKLGLHLIPRHYYQPIPEESDLSDKYFETVSEMPGLVIHDQIPLGLLDTVFVRYMTEFRDQFSDFENKKIEPWHFFLINGSYMAIDAQCYYSFIRHFKPKYIVEIGGGHSSLLAGAACVRNFQETGNQTKLTIIEPYPSRLLREGFPGLSKLVVSKVQDIDLRFFESLESGDILFIDSSHVLRSGGDVQYEYLEILPRLKPGVLVHVHDISLPKAYPRVYSENRLFWNEQFLLQAFLAFNSKFEIVWPGNYMMIKYPDKLLAVFPEFKIMRQHYPQSEPTSFWMRVRE